LQNIIKLKNLYNQKQKKAAKFILFEKAEAVFKKVLKTRELRVDDVYERVKELIKVVKKVAERLTEKHEKDVIPRSYMQAACIKNADAACKIAIEAPSTTHPREEKKIVIKIANKIETEAIKK
jgi:hypothetical protein